MSEHYYVITIFIIFCLFYFVDFVDILNRLVLFNPTIVTKKDMIKFCKNYKNDVKELKIKSNLLANSSESGNTNKDIGIINTFQENDNTFISGMLVNRLEKPSWDGDIIFYCHGNSRWIGKLFNSNTIKILSTISTQTNIFMFDYRGYV